MRRILLVLAVLMAACNIERRPHVGPDTHVSQILVAPDSVMIDPLAVLQFGVYGRTASGDSVPVDVTWSASAGQITSGAVYTADTSESDVTVTASLSVSSTETLTGSAIVHKKRIVSIFVTPSAATLLSGQTQQFATFGVRNSGDTVAVSATYTATGGTITPGGLYTAGATSGNFLVIASRRALAETAFVTITRPPVASVDVSPANASLSIGRTQQFTATMKDSANNVLSGRVVTWSSSASGVASVSASGLVTAVAAGSATITATSEGKSGTATVTVTVVPVATVTVSPASGTVNIGATLPLSAATKDSAGNVLTGRAVTWSSTATGVATVSPAGVVTGVTAGSVIVIATSEGKSDSAAITVSSSTQSHTGRFVTPTGSSSGDGTMAKPWDLATALSGAGGKILPGDTVWLRGGTYNGSFTSSLKGTAAAPIVVRQYPGERATLDGTSSTSITLNVDGQWTIYWGFEIKNTILTRSSSGLAARPSGVYVRNATNVKLVNLIIHDTGHGTYIENAAHSIEIYGWIVYNGGNDTPSRSDGHGIYVRNDGTTQKVIADNIVFNQFGFGIHSYAESGDLLQNLKYEGNVLFNNSSLSVFTGPNMILGGLTVADNDTIRNNFYYFSPNRGARNLRLGYTTQVNASADVEGNYIVGGTTEAVDVTLWQNLHFRNNTLVETGRVLAFADPNTVAYDWSGNTHYRSATASAWGFGGTDYSFGSWRQATGLGATDQVPGTTPSVPAVFVRPNKYEPGRANVIVFNWGRQASVSVDLSNVLAIGQRFEIRNVQDLWGTPVVSSVYGGGSVSVPMGGVAPPQPVGGSPTAPLQTGPDFDVFVVFPLP